MEIAKEIMEAFFQELEKDNKFSNTVIEELKNVLENRNATKEELFEAIKKGENEIDRN